MKFVCISSHDLVRIMSSPVNDELSRSMREVMNTSQFGAEFVPEPIIEERVVEVFVPVYEKEIVEVPQVCP